MKIGFLGKNDPLVIYYMYNLEVMISSHILYFNKHNFIDQYCNHGNPLFVEC